MQKGLVTVVLPVYNVEKYLDRCLESVVNQTYRDLEIILVDDGSPDNSPALCEAWAAKDSRIKVIHKKNAGLGMARNTGIENANGEYICFFDSDDYIALDTVESCYIAAQKEDADIVCFGLHNVDDCGTVITNLAPNTEKCIYENDEIMTVFLPEMIAADPDNGRRTNLWMSACGALFAMRVIERSGWRFVSEREIISEDVYSLLGLYRHINKAVVLPRAFYYYCANGVSLTHVYRPDRFYRVKHFFEESVKRSRSLGYVAEVERRLTRLYLSFSIAALKQEAASDRPEKEKFTSICKMISDPVFFSAVIEGKSSLDGMARKLLFFAIQHKMYRLCYLMLKAKS